MDRLAGQTALTSSEAAALLDVHPSTVKRWCNDGDLASELTPGGHRRIPLGAVVGLARERGIATILSPFHPYEPHVLNAFRAIADDQTYRPLHNLALQWAKRGDFERLEQLFLALGRADFLDFCSFCDHAVRGLLSTIGHEWEKGRLRVGDEHMVTQAIHSALLVLRREWLDGNERPLQPSRNGTGDSTDRPVALVGTMEGNLHSIGALCVRMLLEREGWQVFYPGADVPIEDFAVIQKSREASLVCVSLPHGGTLGDVTRILSLLADTYDRARPYSVAFGGAAGLSLEGRADDGPFSSVAFYQECESLRVALDQGLGGQAA